MMSLSYSNNNNNKIIYLTAVFDGYILLTENILGVHLIHFRYKNAIK